MAVKKSVFDPKKLLEDLISQDFDLAAFEKVDESDIEQAPNFLTWMLDRRFCNASLLPWQIEAGMHQFSEYCPKCSNKEYLTELFDESVEEIRDNVQFLEFGKCPKCKSVRSELFSIEGIETLKPHIKTEFVGNAGQRSGKSNYVVSASTYQLHRWLKIPNPIEFYNLPKSQLITMSFTGISKGKAEDNLWLPFKGIYNQSPWFQKYNAFLKMKEKEISLPLFSSGDTYIFYPYKRLLMDYMGSEGRKMRGAARLSGAIDEIGWYNNDLEKGKSSKVMSASDTYAALSNSLETMKVKALKKYKEGFYNCVFPAMYNTSSPSSVSDKIMSLTNDAVRNMWMLAIHRHTWMLNPDYDYETLRRSKVNLSDAEFWRDFGAVPPFSDSPYISESRVLEKLCDPLNEAIFTAERVVHTDSMGDSYYFLEPKQVKQDFNPHMLAIDNGYNNNGFAAVLLGYDPYKKKILVKGAVSLAPEHKRPIHLPMVFEHFVLQLVKWFNIRQVFYDRWQSLDQILRLRDFKVDAQSYSLRYDVDFLPFRQQLISGNFVLPPLEMSVEKVKEEPNRAQVMVDKPITLMCWQALTVREINKKLLKPLVGDDDVFRAFALGGSRMMQPDIQKTYTNSLAGSRVGGGGYLGSVHSFGKGGGGAMTGVGGNTINFARAKTYTRK